MSGVDSMRWNLPRAQHSVWVYISASQMETVIPKIYHCPKYALGYNTLNLTSLNPYFLYKLGVYYYACLISCLICNEMG